MNGLLLAVAFEKGFRILLGNEHRGYLFSLLSSVTLIACRQKVLHISPFLFSLSTTFQSSFFCPVVSFCNPLTKNIYQYEEQKSYIY